jgi:hypothetical protein
MHRRCWRAIVDAVALEAANGDHLVVVVVVYGSVAREYARRCDRKDRGCLVFETDASGLADHLREPDCFDPIHVIVVGKDEGLGCGVGTSDLKNKRR